MASVSNVTLQLQSGSSSTIMCKWSCSLSHVDHYEVQWYYGVYDNVAYDGGTVSVSATNPSDGSTNPKNATYTPPSNAKHVRAFVKPVSTTRTVNGTETSYWEGTWTRCEEDYYLSNNPPETPTTPTVEMGDEANSSSKYKLTAYIDSISDSLTDYIEFYYRQNGTKKVGTVIAKKDKYLCKAYMYVSPGNTYAVAARAINSLSSGTKSTLTLVDGSSVTVYDPIYSSWSAYSSEVSPPPDSPSSISCSAVDDNVVKVSWSKSTGATGYEVQYAKKKEYLEKSSNETQSQTVDTNTDTTYITGLDTGEEWFFKVRATNDAGNSGWSSIVSVIIGSTPEAPTTWSTTTTAMIGDQVTLYWVHNCEDGSDQSAAQLQITPSTSKAETINIVGDESSYILETENYDDGTEVVWMVRTAGITGEFGPWSTARTVTVYAPASVAIEVPEVVESFPINIVAQAEPTSQRAISYYISLIALDSYEVTGPTGELLRVNAGDEIYSKLYNTATDVLPEVLIPISVGDVTLQDGQTYKVTVTAVMNTGLMAETSAEFEVRWSSELYEPYASVALDSNNLVAYIAPYCERLIDYEDGDDPDTAERELVSDVTLAVYRRESDGTFTLIGDGIENSGAATITDPHPALDYARYRIVVQDDNTGQISYEDLPGLPFNQPYVVIQWDEDWSDFDYDGEAKMIDSTWSGSMIKIPYNIDVSESHNPDTELVEYIGRSHPVGYYGTQLGESGNWSVDVPKDDEETIYALRRLAVYLGDVYVREPSGTGYWAQITVSMNTNHCEVVVPVTFNISRVEGGM